MTGLDLSPASLGQARALAERTGTNIRYVESEVYAALDVLEPGGFDLVYTGVGALNWLPDVRRWAQVVTGLLRPGGRLFLREGHPVLWSLDYARAGGLLALAYPYLERVAPLVLDEPGTYVETEVVFANNLTHEWNHGLGQVVTAVLEAGIELTQLVEHDSVPWDALPGQMDPGRPTGSGGCATAPSACHTRTRCRRGFCRRAVPACRS